MEKNDTWKRIYELAADFYRLEPWTFLEETDVFGVESPVTGKQYFISIMGSAGVIDSFAAYEGVDALAEFWWMQNSQTPDGSDFLSIPHLILTFENEKDIDPGQLERFRKLSNDLYLFGSFPEVRYNVPGRYPNEPGDEQLNEMVIILEQSIDVARRAQHNPSLILPEYNEEDTYLVRKLDKDLYQWKDHYLKLDLPDIRYNFSYSPEDIAEINELPLTNAVMQAHSQLMPMQVVENDIVYFSYMAILVNKKSGRIEHFETLIAKPDFHSMLEKVPAIYLKFIKLLGFRPRAIEVKSDRLFEMISEPMMELGIKFNRYKELPHVTNAINGIIEYSRKA